MHTIFAPNDPPSSRVAPMNSNSYCTYGTGTYVMSSPSPYNENEYGTVLVISIYSRTTLVQYTYRPANAGTASLLSAAFFIASCFFSPCLAAALVCVDSNFAASSAISHLSSSS